MADIKPATEETNENSAQKPAARGQTIMADKQDFGYEQTLVNIIYCLY